MTRRRRLSLPSLAFVMLLAALLAALTACTSPTAPAAAHVHAWSVRTDIDHHPHSYFWCTSGEHEPRDDAEAADATAWYAGGGR